MELDPELPEDFRERSDKEKKKILEDAVQKMEDSGIQLFKCKVFKELAESY